jgi:hypothetical protein
MSDLTPAFSLGSDALGACLISVNFAPRQVAANSLY